ncbi:MAG: hypothetical protein IKU55_03305 [Clostridia bacterium]|nr:hypothetical protein [Clostridia bacterium]
MNASKKETLSRRERVRRAIEHKPVDRMPIDLGCHYSTGISAFAYYNLRKYLGLSTDSVEVIDPGQFLARVDDDLIDRFHLDAMVLHPGFPKTRRWNPRGEYEFIVPDAFRPELQENGAYHIYRPETPQRRSIMPKNGFFFDGDGGVDMWGYTDDEWWTIFAKEAHRIRYETDFFTMLCGFCGFFGDIDECCMMYAEPEEFLAVNRKRLDDSKARFAKLMRYVGNNVDSIELNGDLGTQTAPYVGTDIYEQCTYPFLKEFCKIVHESSDIKIFMHCCGSMQHFIPYLIDAGVDVINPVQISAADMDPHDLKRKYGDQITFWGGGCNAQHVLGTGTPDDVRKNVRELCSILAPGGGFVFNQVHNVMGNVPPENIVAMLETAYEESFLYGEEL